MVLCTLLSLLVVAVPADSRVVSTETRGGDGMAVLRRAAAAGHDTAYRGVRSVSWRDRAGETVSARVDVAHQPGVGTLVSPRRGPGSARGVLVGAESWDGPDDALLDLMERNFWVDVDGADTVGGRPTVRVTARRDDGLPAARFWTDEATGLLLRREVYDIGGTPARSSGFTSIRFGGGGVDEAAAPPRDTVRGEPWGDVLDGRKLSALRAGGWPLPERLGLGFVLVEARATGEGPERVTHLTYSDGIGLISVFTQRGSLGTNAVAGMRAVDEDGARVHVADDGGQHQRMWAADGFVYTVLADAPCRVAATALAKLPDPGDFGFWDRVGRGLDRLRTWSP